MHLQVLVGPLLKRGEVRLLFLNNDSLFGGVGGKLEARLVYVVTLLDIIYVEGRYFNCHEASFER